jgi:hypothetical protein
MARRDKGLILVFDLDQTLIDTKDVFLVKKNGNEDAELKLRRDMIENPYVSDDFIEGSVNARLIEEVLIPASKLRGNGVDGIFLLTNNGSVPYVESVCRYLANTIGNTDGNRYFFDYIMTRNDPSKRADPFSKNVSNIKHMLRHDCPFSKRHRRPVITIDDYDLAQRLFFFDDQEHVIHNELFKNIGLGSNRRLGLALPNFSSHYIKIQGVMGDGFFKMTGGPEDDQTQYGPIKRELAKISAPEVQGGSRKRSRRHKKRLTKYIRRRKN